MLRKISSPHCATISIVSWKMEKVERQQQAQPRCISCSATSSGIFCLFFQDFEPRPHPLSRSAFLSSQPTRKQVARVTGTHRVDGLVNPNATSQPLMSLKALRGESGNRGIFFEECLQNVHKICLNRGKSCVIVGSQCMLMKITILFEK